MQMGRGKVLIVIGDAAEAMDTLYPFYRLKEGEYEVVVAGPEKRLYHLVMHEIPPGWDITREGPSYHLASDIAFRDVKPEEYVGIFITGGRAPEYIRYDEDLMAITRHFFEAQKPVARCAWSLTNKLKFSIIEAIGNLAARKRLRAAASSFDGSLGHPGIRHSSAPS